MLVAGYQQFINICCQKRRGCFSATNAFQQIGCKTGVKTIVLRYSLRCEAYETSTPNQFRNEAVLWHGATRQRLMLVR
jgi:hypothetical protein